MSKHSDPIALRRVAVGTVSWLAFAFAWWFVLQRDPRTWVVELVVPVVSLLVVTVLTLAWVRHNLGIYERKGPRRGVPGTGAPYTHDSLGRVLVLPSLDTARVVRVDVQSGTKRYEVLQ